MCVKPQLKVAQILLKLFKVLLLQGAQTDSEGQMNQLVPRFI